MKVGDYVFASVCLLLKKLMNHWIIKTNIFDGQQKGENRQTGKTSEEHYQRQMDEEQQKMVIRSRV